MTYAIREAHELDVLARDFVTLPDDEVVPKTEAEEYMYDDNTNTPLFVSVFQDDAPSIASILKSWVVVMNGPNDAIVSQYFDQRYLKGIEAYDPIPGNHDPIFWDDDHEWQEIPFDTLPLKARLHVHETYHDLWWSVLYPITDEVQA